MKMNIGISFIKSVKKHFQKTINTLIFSALTLSWIIPVLPGIGNIIKQHNSKVFSKPNEKMKQECN